MMAWLKRQHWAQLVELALTVGAIAGALILSGNAWSQVNDPVVTSWMINLNGTTASSDDPTVNMAVSGIVADVHRVRYNATDVYIDTPSVPSHKVGPFNDGNPSTPSDAGLLYRIPRATATESGTHPGTGLGPIGVFVNGVVFYNMLDAFSYEDEGVWNNNAIVVRADGMDDAAGHPSPIMGGGMMGPPKGLVPPEMEPFLHKHSGGGDYVHSHGGAKAMTVAGLYHYHQQSPALRAQLGDDGSEHSPLVGFAFDGVPVYGPYGYANANGPGGTRRMESSWRVRAMADRSTLPDGTVLPLNLQGPSIGGQYPLGYFAEDFEYVPGLGDLDEYNGRFAVTPEYPEGIYAYYTTIDAAGDSAYPYIVGPQYFADALSDDLMQSVTVPGDVVEYVPHAGATDGEESIVSDRSPSLVEAGETFTLTGPDGGSYSWKRNGSLIADEPPRVMGAHGKTLAFDPVMESDSGVYTVLYDNGGAKAVVESAPFALNVLPFGSLPVGNGIRIIGCIVAIVWAGYLALRNDAPVE